MSVPSALVNPFPGLRPFEAEEDHLFFGREPQIDELLRRLRISRFLSVVGTSGCGKSSLIRCGLIPSLQGGLMAGPGSGWRISIMRPGEDPFGHLAQALAAPDVIGGDETGLAAPSRVLVEAALRRGDRGLIDAVRQAHIPPDDNVLVLVDQFEELFRFQRNRRVVNARDESVAFVKLLLEASQQSQVPIYIVLTMRSDFIGECMEYPGLPEALNEGQFLVPRMTRDQLRIAITGPVAVAGGDITPRLVQRLLNEVGSDQDQLPILQHALMRTWECWVARTQGRGPIDFADYDSAGGLRQALSRHAEEAYEEVRTHQAEATVARLFQAMTDLVTDPRGTRRPCTVTELAAVAAVPDADVARIVDAFRKPGRSFLMPPADVPLVPHTIVDLSHESLMRCWERLRTWAEEERASASVYLRLSKAAQWYEDGTAGLWRDPELGLGLQWRDEQQPTAAWARRYDDAFGRAMSFLDRSERERDLLVAERRAERRRKWRQLQWTAGSFGVLFIIMGIAAWVATRESARARTESARAEANLRLARTAVDESLAVADRDPSLLGVDVPEIVEFRRELLDKAQRFYLEFVRQAPASEDIRREMAYARLQLGHINRALDARAQAAADYRAAIAEFEELAAQYPDRVEYRRAQADAQNWLGEALRRTGGQFTEAKDAYDTALVLESGLIANGPPEPELLQATARTRYNRGILLAEHAGRDGATLEDAEADLTRAIQLLEPLAEKGTSLQASQELARSYNNLGSVVALAGGRIAEAQALYEQAVAIHENLTAADPRNREFKMELIKFYNNLSDTLRERGAFAEAQQRNSQALQRIEALASPAPSVGIERADSYTLRGRIAQDRPSADALVHYRRAFDLYTALGQDVETQRLPEFHLRYGDLLVNIASLAATGRRDGAPGVLLEEALQFYLTLVERAATNGSPAEARNVLDTLARVRPELPDPAAQEADRALTRWQDQLEARARPEAPSSKSGSAR